MAGIYIHIPFCKSRCLYCDFFSTTRLPEREQYVKAAAAEIGMRTDYLPDKHIKTIYFGGGTPSLLDSTSIAFLLNTIRENYDVDKQAEITLEGNPNDLTKEYLHQLKRIGINRLSIGIQSFDNKQLLRLGRRHTADDALDAIQQAQNAGFENISIDLIYGLPAQTLSELERDIDNALALNIQHLSTYCLTYESGTRLTQLRDAGKIQETNDDTLNSMYETICRRLKEADFEHYEVSNFTRKGYRSQHNSAYWNDTPYLGIGAAAHSYNQKSRQWNPSNMEEYIYQITNHKQVAEIETLSDTDRYNERIMLSLRTAEGIQLNQLTTQEQTYCIEQARPYITTGKLVHTDNRLIASAMGINILNHITEHLMR